MKTTEEMIEVMQLFKEGKKIERQFANYGGNWEEDPTPSWDWAMFDYRVKPEVKYRPYKDTEEMLDDFCERFPVKRAGYGEPFIWIKSETGVKYLITAIGDIHVWTACASCSMDDLFKKYTYKNGSPCGKKVEE